MPPTSTFSEAREPTAPISIPSIDPAVAQAAYLGLTSAPKTLPPWLFYDEAGSRLFEQITLLPEYYLTRTERELFTSHADEVFTLLDQNLTVAELGAGTATKSGVLLRALTHRQPHVLYQPIDISPSALEEAQQALEQTIPALTVRPQVANYITDPIHIDREPHSKVLALYIGSSIGNFSPSEARAILRNLRVQLRTGDALLLGTDLAPSPSKSIRSLLAAYSDAAGITAAFNRNILTRLNRELSADFDLTRFTHQACWNPTESRIEMHLASTVTQTVHIPATPTTNAFGVTFHPGETIHTENSYKFTPEAISQLLADSDFTPARSFSDPQDLFAVTLATAL